MLSSTELARGEKGSLFAHPDASGSTCGKTISGIAKSTGDPRTWTSESLNLALALREGVNGSRMDVTTSRKMLCGCDGGIDRDAKLTSSCHSRCSGPCTKYWSSTDHVNESLDASRTYDVLRYTTSRGVTLDAERRILYPCTESLCGVSSCAHSPVKPAVECENCETSLVTYLGSDA